MADKPAAHVPERRRGPDDAVAGGADSSPYETQPPSADAIGDDTVQACDINGDHPQAIASQQGGGAGAPMTGASPSPGEGVTEEQMKASGVE